MLDLLGISEQAP